MSAVSEKPPLKKKYAVTKLCPGCQQHVPVARKTCICGHQFANKNLKKLQEKEGTPILQCRRTERVKKLRTDFYDAAEIDNSNRKSPRAGSNKDKDSNAEDSDEVPKKRRGRPKGSLNKPKADNGTPEEEDMFASVSAEKALQYSIILAEVNRKLGTQNFNPL